MNDRKLKSVIWTDSIFTLVDIVLPNPYRECLNARKVHLGDAWALKSQKPCLLLFLHLNTLNGMPPCPSKYETLVGIKNIIILTNYFLIAILT